MFRLLGKDNTRYIQFGLNYNKDYLISVVTYILYLLWNNND